MKEGGKNMEETAKALVRYFEAKKQSDHYLDETFGRENMFTLVVSEKTLPSILDGDKLLSRTDEAWQEYRRLRAEGL